MRRAVLMSACCVAALAQSGCGLKKGKVEAEAVVTNRYTRMHLRDYERAMTRYSPKFFKQTPQREWKRMLSKLQFKLGRIQGFELVRWNYGTRSDAAGAGTYVVLEYTVNYAKHPAHETLTVFKPKGGQFGIPGHNINSAGLLLE